MNFEMNMLFLSNGFSSFLFVGLSYEAEAAPPRALGAKEPLAY